tara:strand:+ start:8862 stop:10709 length:1848 start_codon:yes stop_codon:yes gene_type:complete
MEKFRDLDSDRKQLKTLLSRSFFIFTIIFLIYLIFSYQIVKLMVLDNINYVSQSDENRTITVPIYPARGLIYDSQGNIITENVVSHDLVFSGSNLDELETDLIEIEELIGNSASLWSLEWFTDKEQSINFKEAILYKGLDQTQIAKFQLEKSRWSSVKIKPSLKRLVLDENLYSHVIGYLGPVSREEVISSYDFKYPLNYFSGKKGLEKEYESILRGGLGYKSVEIDAYGNEIKEISRKPPQRPENLYLSINKKLQLIARKELDGRKGAVIGIEPSTGLVKVLVSSPDFNPNLFNGTSTSGEITKILKDKDSPLFNRVISGNYPPASTLKPFIGLLALENGIIDWDYVIDDKGVFQIEGEGRRYRGWKEGGHGEVDLKKAIAVSSDVFFYQLATNLTIDKLSDFLKKFGFGLVSGIDLDNESRANLPTRNWKLGTLGEAWFVGDTVNLGIGQGFITITPMQLALATSIIANKGYAYKPRLVERINELHTTKEILYEVEIQDKSNWNKLEDAMEAVTNSWYGTAYNLSLTGKIKIVGKTGTAQIKSLTEEDLSVREEYEGIRESVSDRDHALFVGYGPIKNPKLVMVVIVENGESGSTVAAPIAQKIIDEYLKEDL